ncbi:MAG: bifunctional 4-hydroxy-2-oxoglutarate aldolase/2-dehydro-3-deoxy-phosphogluconate aldolase [Spirochaetota bacterium]
MHHANVCDEHVALLRNHPVVAVLVADEPGQAVAACRALVRGGIRAVELALRTPRALDCIEAIVREVPEILPIAGTVIEPGQIAELANRGVAAAVSPGCNPVIIREALDAGLSFAPGICTPSDIEAALGLGCTLLKYFPAEPSGGLPMLRSMAGPYAHRGLEFIPLGGLKLDHVEPYLKDSFIVALGGSWLAPSELVREGNTDEIERRAAEAAASRPQEENL